MESLPGRGYVRFAVQMLNTVAASPESTRVLIGALSEFDAELVHNGDGSYAVTVRIDGDHAETIAVLHALEQYVTEQALATQLSLNGREYVMHPDPAAQRSAEAESPAETRLAKRVSARPDGGGGI